MNKFYEKVDHLMKGSTKLEKGRWTLSLRKMAIDVMDKMILRPVTILVSDPRNGNKNTFQGIRDKLTRKKYDLLSNWKDDVLKVFNDARKTNDPLINDICAELEQFFYKKYNLLEEFSEFKFRDVLSRLLGKEIVDDEAVDNGSTEQSIDVTQENQTLDTINDNNNNTFQENYDNQDSNNNHEIQGSSNDLQVIQENNQDVKTDTIQENQYAQDSHEQNNITTKDEQEQENSISAQDNQEQENSISAQDNQEQENSISAQDNQEQENSIPTQDNQEKDNSIVD